MARRVAAAAARQRCSFRPAAAWSTGFNNFVFDTSKFSDAKAMVDTIHRKGAKVILWATSMIDQDSSNYAEAVEKGYVIKVRRRAGSPPRC